MANLLEIVRFNAPQSEKKVHPLMMEFQVDPSTSPYLVSSSTDLMWLTQDSLNAEGRLRAAVRRDPRTDGDIFLRVVEAIEEISLAYEWGNVLSTAKPDLERAVAYLINYEVGDLEILASEPLDVHLSEVTGLPVSKVDWLPEGVALMVPRDRSYLGFLGRMDESFVLVVHNSSRGIVILREGAAAT